MIQITADTRRAVVTNKELLTVGSAGIQVQFTLSEDWDTLSKLAVFRVGDDGIKVDVVLGESLTCVVPPEVLTQEDEVLFIGIYGANGQGTVIIPTVWASAGVVKPGTEPNTPAESQPTPEIWAQILGVAQDAEQTATEAMSAVEAGLQDLSALEGNVETAEAQRVVNEQDRVAAEQQRVAAENSREAAETARTDNEEIRVNAEADRAAAETARASAETARASAEASRVTAEEGRVAAEAYREEKYAEYVETVSGYADAASASATSAAGSATDAASSASSASTSAGQAASSASSASTSASQASNSASSASASATTASSAATTATTKAGEAAASATAAGNAQTAAETAQTAAETAQSAAESAQAAAEEAAESIEESAAQIAQNTQDISDAKNAITENENRLFNLDGIVAINPSDWDFGQIYIVDNQPWAYYWSNKRIRTKENFYYTLPKGTKISLSNYNGYRYIVGYRVGTTYYTTGWIQKDFIIPFDSDVVINISKNPEVVEDNITDLLNMLTINTTPKTTAYYYNGEIIDSLEKHYYNWIERVGTIPAASDINTNYGKNVTSDQGMAHYGNYFVVSYSNNVLAILNDSDFSIVSVLDAESGHANAITFSSVFYDSNDMFPLLYCINTLNGGGANTLKVLRISDTSTVTTIDSIILENLNYPIAAINPDTNLLYVLSYKNNSMSAGTNNSMIFTEYIIRNGNLELLRTCDMGIFIPTIQDATIVNDLMFVVSYGANSNANNAIYVLNLGSLSLRNKLSMFDNYFQSINEPEGITQKGNLIFAVAGQSVRNMQFVN